MKELQKKLEQWDKDQLEVAGNFGREITLDGFEIAIILGAFEKAWQYDELCK